MSYQEYLMSADGSEILLTTIANPKGGIYTSDNSETGAIVIVFPPSWAGNMSKLSIDVLQLTDDLSFTILCKGQSPNGTWEKCSAHIIGDKSANNEVRFGYTGAGCAAGEEARACIVIGAVTSVWASPKVSISNFTEHGRDYDIGNVNINWEIHILKDLTGYVFDVDIPDALLDARGIVNQGDLATKNEADANVLNMTNAPAEAGADVTGAHSADIDALQTINAPVEAGADVTGLHAAYDVFNVNGVPSSNIISAGYLAVGILSTSVAYIRNAAMLSAIIVDAHINGKLTVGVTEADVTADNTAHNTDHLNGSQCYSGDFETNFYENLNMRDGKYVTFYDSDENYIGRVSGGYDGIILSAPANLWVEAVLLVGNNCLPSLDNDYDLGTSSLRWRGLNVANGGYVYIGDSSHTFKLHVSNDGGSTWYTYDAYIDQSS